MNISGNTAIIITSIASSDNAVLQAFALETRKSGARFIVIGDSKSPPGFMLKDCEFYSLQQQKALDLKLAASLPESTYSRKNIGYLLAIQQGKEFIIETDDDNFPLPDFWAPRTQSMEARYLLNKGWVNVYRYFTSENIWPRGFALECLRGQTVEDDVSLETVYCPIQQGLSDDNPDVDGIYRLTLKLPVRFDRNANIALGNGSWCPFNSQNTTWFREAFPLMYLPTHCNFRMTDIWRSFVAQRIAWANNWSILHHHATVRQERNEHNLLKDFEDEIPGYLNNGRICNELMSLDLKPGLNYLFDNLIICYEKFIESGLVGKAELKLLDDWISDCHQ